MPEETKSEEQNEMPKGKAAKQKTQKSQQTASVSKTAKDPGIAALVSVVGLMLLGAPALGYFYLDKIKRGIIYLLLNWIVGLIVIGLYFLGSTTGIGVCICAPVFIIPILFGLYIVWDVYIIAKGEKPKLPDLENKI